MIKLQGYLPEEFILACSGGVDSMSALDFVRRKHKVTALYVNHGTAQSNSMQTCVKNYCDNNNITGIFKTIDVVDCPSESSPEEHWRDERYRVINKVSNETGLSVITCHHLDDCVETWIWSAMHGKPKIVPRFRGDNVIRPFRLTPKRAFRSWAERHDVPYVEDSSNNDMRYTRNYVRHVCVPHAKTINPGIEKTIAKKISTTEA